MRKLISTLFLLILSSQHAQTQIENENVVTGALVHDYRGLELAAKGHLLTAKHEFEKALRYMPWFNRSLLNLKICNDAVNKKIDKSFAVKLFHAMNYLSTSYSLKTLSFADELLLKHQDYAPGYLLRAQIYLRLHRPAEAMADYNKAISLSPKNKLAYFFRGKTYAHKKQYTQAIQDFSKAINLDESYAKAYLERGNVYTDQRKYDEAVADYDVALEAWPKWGKEFKVFAAYLNRGIGNIHKGKNRDALVDLNMAITLNPKITEAYFNQGLAYLNLNLLKNAISNFDYVLEEEPENIEAYFNRGFSWQKQRDYDAAVIDYLKVVELDSSHVNAFFRLGVVYTKQKEFEKVITAFARVIQLEPGKYWAYYWQALAYDRLKMWDKAIDAYTSFLEKTPRRHKQQVKFSQKRVGRLNKYLAKKS